MSGSVCSLSVELDDSDDEDDAVLLLSGVTVRPWVLEVDLVVAAGVRTVATGACGLRTAVPTFNLEDNFLVFFRAVEGGAELVLYFSFSRSFLFLIRATVCLSSVWLAPVRMESTEKE